MPKLTSLKLRPSARQRGYTHEWDKAAKAFLAEHPLCIRCTARRKTVPATVVDHIVPHRGNQLLFWDRSNWQSLCKWHHDAAKHSEEIRGYSTEIGVDGFPIDPKHPSLQ